MGIKSQPQDAELKGNRARRANLRAQQTLQVIVQFADSIHCELRHLHEGFPAELFDHLAAASIELETCCRRLRKALDPNAGQRSES
jgi:hypothetical protein